MKHIFLLTFLIGVSLSGQAQEVIIDTNYYAPPPVVRRRVLTEDPDNNPNHQSNGSGQASRKRKLLEKLNEVHTWYVSAETGLRSDGSVLSNSFDRLVSNPAPTKASWSALLGYTYRNAWTIEAGYIRAPIHLNISIANGSNPLVFNYLNSGYGIPLRIKRRVGSGKRAANGTGFWVTGGAWLIPNGSGQTGDFQLIGYNRSGRNRVDTIRLNNSTTILKQVTGIAELGVDYTTRLASRVEMDFYVRKYWGLSNALQSDLVYTVNNGSKTQATVTADGTGWGFGLSLRYLYGRQYEVKNP
ncbi:hypothetical protein [Spirosoma radiotolerans]|uniref:Outer membrane protein beta-barrel domain-containing protein n=1 Tax=Spirosoma radiotolerans TaxID=1379870 RepID=A0A0E3ZVN6_9BACT|nr:hypothetical protein [Spirosoma radiotolerans]AKD55149.1 hypothetical protein SD10_09750 [Spirosoma radiotolerans]